MNNDPRNDPNVRLVGKRIGGQVPNLANANVNVTGARGGLDITHIRFHAPFIIPVTDADGVDIGWGVACLGCTILHNSPMAKCVMYPLENLVHPWPTAPVLVEVVEASEPKVEPVVTVEEIFEEVEGD